MWLEGPGDLVFYTRRNMEVLEALFAQGRVGTDVVQDDYSSQGRRFLTHGC